MSKKEEKELIILQKRRDVLKSRLTLIKGHLESVKQKIDTVSQIAELPREVIIELESRSEKYNEIFSEFDDIQTKFEVQADDIESQLHERNLFENQFYSCSAETKKIIDDYYSALTLQKTTERGFDSPGSVGSLQEVRQNNVSGVKLPSINLPKFSGDYRNWLEFRDLFESLIHANANVPNIQKMHYLRSSLEAGAAQVIRSLEFCSENYEIAWKTLCERYNNRGLLIQTHVKSLFNLPIVNQESSSEINQMCDTISKNLQSLNALKQPTDHWDTLLIYIFSQKLDKKTFREWEERRLGDRNSIKEELPSLKEFLGFLRQRADLLETLELSKALKYQRGEQKHYKVGIQSRSFHTGKALCSMCKGDHFINNCSDFLRLSVKDREQHVKVSKLCFNCLRPGHTVGQCRSKWVCNKCRSKHSTFLHFNKDDVDSDPNISLACSSATGQAVNAGVNVSTQPSSFSGNTTSQNSCVLLQTALVHVVDFRGKVQVCRALLDGASMSNFITDECCNRLGLQKTDMPTFVSGIGERVSNLKFRCKASVQSVSNAFHANLTLIVIPKISGVYPSYKVEPSKWDIPKNVCLADPDFHKPGKIDLLIGGGIYLDLLCIGQIKLGKNLPTLQKTRFGWVFGGVVGSNKSDDVLNESNRDSYESSVECYLSSELDIQGQLLKFWEIEEISSEKRVMSMEETQCEQIFVKTTYRTEEGRFVVQIPLKCDPSCLGDSKHTALRRFHSLEKRLEKNPEFKQKYSDFMEEYRRLNHMSRIKGPDNSRVSYFFPHHGVVNPNSPTTKLRVVFDGSSPTDSGICLNELQMVGPVIQEDLLSILLRFRQWPIVIASDIVKMYRQILVEPEQRCLQRIVWRGDASREINVYELNTVTYGTASASFLAVRCLKQLAIANAKSFPKASQTIERDFYMDDMLTGANSVGEAIQLIDEVSAILKSGCFPLQKWASNSKECLAHVHSDSATGVLPLVKEAKSKTLGLYWLCDQDSLMYNISTNSEPDLVTKRTLLSSISQVFDPLGLVSPCVIIAKVLLQKLWLCKLSWDESLPSDLATIWHRFRFQLPLLNEMKIPRHVVAANSNHISICGFADASSEAFGACIYLRSENDFGQVQVQLLCAKSKVAPLKVITIPRLELCACVILAKLVKKVKSSLAIPLREVYLWSDSTVCLGWIKTPPNLLQVFVGNRVSQIQWLTSDAQWSHVRTSDNPADILSRGIEPRALRYCEMWWSGPRWLGKTRDSWPISKAQIDGDLPEMKKQTYTFKVTSSERFPFEKFSTLNKSKRVFAWCIRFIHNCRSGTKLHGSLSTNELNKSLKFLVKMSQNELFSSEIKCLQMGTSVPKTSKLKKLNPFLCEDHLLRVGGRIHMSDYDYCKKHPLIISCKHHLAKLIFESEHLRLLHAGPQLLLSTVRDLYWPIGGRSLTRKTVHSCVTCVKATPVQKNPIMGYLPKTRVTPAPPFYNVGVDYAGPFWIKDRKGRGNKKSKAYIAIFVCFCTKALHIELVTELSTEAFLATFKIFISRRGKPLNIYSDNGTNFVGARNELRELGKFLMLQENDLVSSISNQGVNWHFIPAMSPHFGGIWEAGVKSCKAHLKRVLKNACLTFEGLYTVLVEIEAILNSRPLTPLSPDPSDLSPLTPSHFLLGRKLTSLPEPDLSNIKENRLSYYQRLQQLKQNFWTRWSKEYVAE